MLTSVLLIPHGDIVLIEDSVVWMVSIVIGVIVLWATLENYSVIDRNTNFIDIDDCVNHTCANGGLCVDGINTYSCNCSAGYTGERCLTGSSKF